MTGAAAAIRKAREALGLSTKEVADQIGISENELLDLEAYDDEIETTVQVRRVRRLLEVLRLQASDLVGEGGDSRSGEAIETFHDLARKVHDHVQRTGVTIPTFETQVGWEVARALADPTAFGDMNLDGLFSVAAAVGVDARMLLVPSSTGSR